MKRSFVIFPVGHPPPEWLFQPMSVSDSGGTVTHRAALMLGEVPPHNGVQVEILPTDTIKSALARAGFTRVVAASPRPPVEVPEVSIPAPAKTPGSFLSRVKKWFGRAS